MDPLDRIHLNSRLDTTLAQQLKQQLDWLIASGQLGPGERLPSLRLAASRLGINFITVRSAYQKLEADGLVETRQGLGTVVLPNDPRRQARQAGAPPSHTAGVIIPSLANPFYVLFLQGVESIAGPAGVMLFVSQSHDDPGESRRIFAQMRSRGVDGILLASQDDEPFLAASGAPGAGKAGGLPLVAADWPPSSGYAVNMDLVNAGYLAARHLLQHGHRRVGLITHAVELPNVAPVEHGYRRALGEAGIPPDPELEAAVHGFDASAGAEGARLLLRLEQPPTAIFAISDLLAVGAMGAIHQAGLRLPDDIAVAGFNDIPTAALVSPGLTTAAAPAFQMGQEAMKMLQRLIAGRRPAVKRLVLPVGLVIRQSCGEHTDQEPC